MNKLHHLATRIFDVPICIHPGKLDAVLAVLGPGLVGLQSAPVLREAPAAQQTVCNGVAVIPIHGTLVKRGGINAVSGMTSYGAIKKMVDDAMGDPECKSLVFDIDSPG